MSLLDDVSIVVTPNGYKAGELYAVIPVPTEGTNVITPIANSDFSIDTGYWTLESGVTIGGGLLNMSSTPNNQGFYRTGLIEIGKIYKVEVTVSGYSQGFIDSGNANSFSFSASNGTHTAYFTGANASLSFAANGTTTLSVDNVSVKEYTSADMDVTRNTAATRVDENGLVNYAEVLGGELVTNGDFATDTDWSKASGWSISGGTANANTTAYRTLAQNIPIILGKKYKVVYDVVSYTSGGVSMTIGANSGILRNAVGTYTEIIEYNNFYSSSGVRSGGVGFVGSIDNVSVKEVTRDNVPRIDYTGGGCPHILAEPQRTNLLPYSEDFSQSVWNKTQLNQDFGYSSPSGELTATKFTTTNIDPYILSSLNGVTDLTYSSSVYLKGTASTIGETARLWLIRDNVDFLYEDFTISGDWERISMTKTFSTTPISFVSFRLDIPNTNVAIGDETFVWGAQLEEGSYATSYIPNFGTALGVTRNQDIFTRDGIGSLINSTEGVLFVEMAALANDGTFRNISLNNGTTGQAVRIYYRNQANKITVLIGSSSGASVTIDVTDTLSFNKIAISYKVNDVRVFVNGSLEGTITSVAMPVGLNELALDIANVLPFFGKVKQLQVYDTALTDEQLLQLTGESGTDFYESYAEMASALTYTIQ